MYTVSCLQVSSPNVTCISIFASYEKLNSGSVAESLVELSGGVSQKILLTEDNSKAAAKDGSLWARLTRCVTACVLVCWLCSLFAANGCADGSSF